MRRLAITTNETEAKLKKVVAKLEDLSGYHSYDVKLIAESDQLLRTKITSLGLDPADTTGAELYYALLVKLETDLEHISRAWNVDDDNAAERLVEIANQCLRGSQVLSLKNVALKSVLKAVPPKKTMKLLRHRSLDSMLKRENLAEILNQALKLESAAWRLKLKTKISKLSAGSFEIKAVAIRRQQQSAEFSVSYTPLTGLILISGRLASKELVGALLDVLSSEELMEGESFYLSTHQFSPDFSALAAELVVGKAVPSVSLAGQNFIDWRETARLLGEKQTAYERLCALHPALHWWQGQGHIASMGEVPISLNIADILESSANRLDYERRQLKNLSREVKTRLVASYFHHPAVSDYIRQQVDGTLMSLEASEAAARPAYELAEV